MYYFSFIPDRNRKKSESKLTPNTAQVNPQINTSQPAPLLTNNANLITSNLKPIQPASNLTNSQNKNLDDSTGTKKQDSNEKRGPGRPKGSTNKGTSEQKLLLAQQQQQSNDIIKGTLFSISVSNGCIISYRVLRRMNHNQLFYFISGKVSNDQPPLKKVKLDVVESETPSAADPPLNVDVVTNNPLKWDVQKVCDFVKNLPGCSDYVEDFQLQEIDGQALMLLKADHLMSAMSIKLGPALKICSAIEGMREELSKN